MTNFTTVALISLLTSPIILLFILPINKLRKKYKPNIISFIGLLIAVRLVFFTSMVPQTLLNKLTLPVFSQNVAMVSEYPIAFYNIPPDDLESSSNELTPLSNKENLISLEDITTSIWLLGIAAVALYSTKKHANILLFFRKNSQIVTDLYTIKQVDELKNKLRIKSEIAIQSCSHIGSPILIGFFKPSIIIPSEMIGSSSKFMLSHELTHLKRGDLWKKLFMLVVCTVHWFNPLVWLLGRTLSEQWEFCCDYAVLENSNYDQRAQYGRVVLSAMENNKNKIALVTSFASNKKSSYQRFTEIIKPNTKRSGRLLVLTAILTILLSGVLVACASPTSSALPNEPEVPAPLSSTSLTSTDTNSPATIEAEAKDNDSFDEGLKLIRNNLINELPEAESHNLSKDDYNPTNAKYPIYGDIVFAKSFGWHSNGKFFRPGINLTNEDILGKPAYTMDSGTILLTNSSRFPEEKYGKFVIVDHGGQISSLYANLDSVLVEQGEKVTTGQQLGTVGEDDNGDAYIFFGIMKDRSFLNPVTFFLETVGDTPDFIPPIIGNYYIGTKVGDYPGHMGVDFAGNGGVGAPVVAAASGIVTTAEFGYTGYGNYVVIAHDNGYETLYASNSELYVNVGDNVAKGQIIASVGSTGNSTGPHLHFELKRYGTILDPLIFIPESVKVD